MGIPQSNPAFRQTGIQFSGIVAIKMFAYDIWGDTVNIAARMEQNSEAGKINISEATYVLVKDQFKCVHRGKFQQKTKGISICILLKGQLKKLNSSSLIFIFYLNTFKFYMQHCIKY